MKITRISVDVVEPGERRPEQLPGSGSTRGRTPRIVPVPNQRRLRYSHEWLESERPVFERFAPLARECGIANPPVPVGGYLTPSMLPGWGAEMDWPYIQKRRVDTY